MNTKDKVKYGIYGLNIAPAPIINATGKGNPGAFIKDLGEVSSFNMWPAIGYTLLDLASKASPTIRDWSGTRFAKLAGFVGYAAKLGVDIVSASKGETSALVNIAVDGSMLYNLGRDNYENYVLGNRDCLEDIPLLGKYLKERKIMKEVKDGLWETEIREQAKREYLDKNHEPGSIEDTD
jgi:hypothetical protein